jgi:hypothetical protein
MSKLNELLNKLIIECKKRKEYNNTYYLMNRERILNNCKNKKYAYENCECGKLVRIDNYRHYDSAAHLIRIKGSI